MHRIGLCIAVLVASAGLAGCLGGPGQELAGCEEILEIRPAFGAMDDQGRFERAPGQSVPILFWVTNTAGVPLTVHLETVPEPTSVWYLTGEDDRRLEPGGQGLLAVELDQASEDGTVELVIGTDPLPDANDVEEAICDYDRRFERTVTLAEPEEAEVAEGGKGVLVRTVGLWGNGTSFYTNHGGFHDRGELPRSYLGDYAGDDPLEVYVYNESRDERPERYNESGYSTTISGFNEALHGLPTVGARMTFAAPDEAYTTEGNEDHQLYGDPLYFYIEALEVETVPCEVPQPVCTPPDEDDVPSRASGHPLVEGVPLARLGPAP